MMGVNRAKNSFYPRNDNRAAAVVYVVIFFSCLGHFGMSFSSKALNPLSPTLMQNIRCYAVKHLKPLKLNCHAFLFGILCKIVPVI